MSDSKTETTPFWRFSLHFYGQSGVSDACIALQDGCGVDVNLLLFLSWLADNGQLLNTAEVKSLDDKVRSWRELTIVPIRDVRRNKSLAYIPAAGASSAAVVAAASEADAVFFDGTFWSSDELIALGASKSRAEDMAHWPIGGAQGSLRFLAELKRARRVLIHINNTNPMLREDSAERAAVHAAGVEVAFDGMEVAL